MNVSALQLNDIYDSTMGRCHICWKRLSFANYGVYGARGAWHIEHRVPRARLGSDHPRNLSPGCIPCNLGKGVQSTRTMRARFGTRRTPMSRNRRDRAQVKNILVGAIAGMAVGGMLWGIRGALLCTVAGGYVGSCVNPEAV